MNNIDAIRGLSGSSPLEGIKSAKKTEQNSGISFKDTLNGFMSEVNSMQTKADEAIEKMATGEITDLHQVMAASEEAKTAFNMMMEIRNKVMDAYDEVMRMRL